MSSLALIDLTGQVFGSWTVLPSHIRVKGKTCWAVRCICGLEKYQDSRLLRRGATTSCGCQRGYLVSIKRKGISTPRYENGEGPLRQALRRIKRQAKERNIQWELSDDTALKIMKLQCYLCGAEPSMVAKHSRGIIREYYSGIDRVDNTGVYTLSNCEPCCKSCNKMKSDLTYADFMNKIREIYERYG